MGQALHRGRRPHANKKKVTVAIIAVVVAVAVLVGAVILIVKRTGKADENPVSSGETTSSTSGAASTTISHTFVTTNAATASKTLPQNFIDRNTASPYIILGDATNGHILYSKNADVPCAPASLTKLMTAIVAIENTPADTIFTIGNEIYMIDPQSSRAYLRVGYRMTLESLLQAMLLPSGNDAAYAVAVQVGRIIAGNDQLDNQAAINAFCQKMNEKAAALGCTNTSFVNPDGIDAAGHLTTASDMLKIAAHALNNKTIASIVATPSVSVTLLSGQTLTWKNTNRLIQENNAYSFAGATGLKTGSTDAAGYCLAASAQRDGRTCIAIVMGAKIERHRWEDAGGLLDISFH